MKTLPAGWEETCLRAALDGAGLSYRITMGLRGAPIATFGYGATAAETIPFRAQVAPGALRITAIVGALEEPTDSTRCASTGPSGRSRGTPSRERSRRA